MEIVLQETSTTSSREKSGKLDPQSNNFLFPKACHQRTRSNSTSKCHLNHPQQQGLDIAECSKSPTY